MAYPYWPANYWPQANYFYWPIRHYRYWPGDEGYKLTMGGVLTSVGSLIRHARGVDTGPGRGVAIVKNIARGHIRPIRPSR